MLPQSDPFRPRRYDLKMASRDGVWVTNPEIFVPVRFWRGGGGGGREGGEEEEGGKSHRYDRKED